MPYLIDSHNLIPKIHGLRLDQLDDEQSLIILLEKYFKRIRKKVVVYFDNASQSSSCSYQSTYLRAHFIRAPGSADEAMIHQLRDLGGEAKNYTVVSSDHWIIDNARIVGASVISSADFARTLLKDSHKPEFKRISDQNDVDYWLEKFQKSS